MWGGWWVSGQLGVFGVGVGVGVGVACLLRW